jgi:hypothetical protein
MIGVLKLECESAETSGEMKLEKSSKEAAMISIKTIFSNAGRMECNQLIMGGPPGSQFAFSKGSSLVINELEWVCEDGRVKLDGLIQGEHGAKIELETRTLDLNGSIQNFALTSLTTDTMNMSGHIGEIDKCKIAGESLTLKGDFENIKDLEISPWRMIMSGCIQKGIGSIEVNAGLVAVICGSVSSTTANMTSPFMFNSYIGELQQTNDVGKVCIGGPDQESITLESIIFVMMGSTLEGRSVVNQALLIFKFLSVTQSRQSIPNQNAMKAWTDAIPVLESLKQDSSAENLTRTIASCGQMTQGELEMREACALYAADSKIVSDLHRDGIDTFQVPILVEELIKANRLFQCLSRVKD